MVHCWQYCHGTPSRRHYHNREWARKMESIGLMPSSTGLPGGATTGQVMSDYIIDSGRFIRAYETLKSSKGFKLNWIDRVASKKKLDPYLYSPNLEEKAIQDVSANLSNSSSSSELLGMYQITEAPLVDLADKPLQLSEPPIYKSTRQKYSCPSCAISAWGKYGLRLICADCDQMLLVSE